MATKAAFVPMLFGIPFLIASILLVASATWKRAVLRIYENGMECVTLSSRGSLLLDDIYAVTRFNPGANIHGSPGGLVGAATKAAMTGDVHTFFAKDGKGKVIVEKYFKGTVVENFVEGIKQRCLQKALKKIESGCVYVSASTKFIPACEVSATTLYGWKSKFVGKEKTSIELKDIESIMQGRVVRRGAKSGILGQPAEFMIPFMDIVLVELLRKKGVNIKNLRAS